MIRFIEPSDQKIPLIVSRLAAFNIMQESTGKLIRVAEFAYGRRDLATMEAVSLDLLNSPVEQGKSAGLYYLAIAAKWHECLSEAQAMLDGVRGQYQARAIQALGAIEFEAGRFDEAGRLHKEAILAAKDNDVFVITVAQAQISAIRSMHKDHRRALDDLHNLWPMMRVLVRSHPYLYAALHNEIACEFLELGRLKEAAHASSIALASPYAFAYPEWRETRDEIVRRGYRTSRLSAAIKQYTAIHKNVVMLPCKLESKSAIDNSEHVQLGRVIALQASPIWKSYMTKDTQSKPEKEEAQNKKLSHEEKQLEVMRRVSEPDFPESKLDKILKLIDEEKANLHKET